MKYYRLLNSDDGMIIDEVDGTTPSYCKFAFTYKDEKGVYHLVDKASGLSIARTRRKKDLESMYFDSSLEVQIYMRSDAYKIKVERFEKLKVAYHMKRG